jgi:hypothetical protein
MTDYAHTKIEEIDAISGVLEGLTFYKTAGGLGVESFGISIVDLEAGATDYPEHDHSPDGIGGQMFAERPDQLGQEEVYVALRGSGTIEIDGESHPLDADHLARVGPGHKRKVLPGPDGLRVLIVGATPS